MGQVLFWLEAAGASVLFVALGTALVARVRRRGRHCLAAAAWGLAAALPWLAAIGAFAGVWYFGRIGLVPLILSSSAGVAVLVGAVVVIRKGRHVSPLTDRPAAAAWRSGRLLLATLAALLLAGMTFWNLDLAVRQQMAQYRVEAGAIALSVSPPRLPDSQNAAVLYREAWEVLDARDPKWSDHVTEWLNPRRGSDQTGHRVPPLRPAPDSMPASGRSDDLPFNPEDAEMLAFLDKAQPVIELLRQAADRPACNFGTQYNPPWLGGVVPVAQRPTRMSNVLVLSARVTAHQGRQADAMRDLRALQRLAVHTTSEPPLIMTLIASAIEGRAFDTFQYVLDQGPLTAEGIETLGAVPTVSYMDALHRSMRMQEAFGLWVFVSINRSMVLVSSPQGAGTFPAGGTSPYRVFLWKDDLAAYLRGVQRFVDLSAEPFYKNANAWRGPRARERPNGIGGLLAHLLGPALSRAGELTARGDAQHMLMELGVAMWRYRLVEGAFPEDLDALVPEYLLAVPIDPFDGEPMKLTVRDGAVTIYSVGPDLDDDGGDPFDRKDGDIRLILGR